MIRLYLPFHYPGNATPIVVTQAFGNDFKLADGTWAYRDRGLPGHEGIDYRANGDMVLACQYGLVYRVHTNPHDHAYGIHVRVEHRNEHGIWKTVYAHLDRAVARVGSWVYPGMVLGISGNTGFSTGAHFHLTLKHEGASGTTETNYPYDIVNPTPYMLDRSGVMMTMDDIQIDIELGTLRKWS